MRLSVFERDSYSQLAEVVRLKSMDLWQSVVFERFEHFFCVESVGDVNQIYFVIKDDYDKIILDSKDFVEKSKTISFCSENIGSELSLEENET